MTATGPSNFGPLTTIFSPPSWCSTEQWIAHNSASGGTMLRWGATCDSGTIGFASECYPSGWSGSNDSALSYKGFSPGLACPSGFTGAASASHIKASNRFILSEYITDLGEHDIATACCPKDYDYNGHYCVSHTLSFASARSLLTTSGSQCIHTTSFKYFQSIGSDASVGQATFQAYPVIIVQDSRSSTSIPRGPQQTGAGGAGSTASGGLSTGAKIAIGVCIPVGIIIVAAVVFIWWHRRRARAKREAGLPTMARNGGQGDPDPYMGKPELDASVQPDTYKKSDNGDGRDGVVSGIQIPPAELPALLSNTPSELPGQKSPDTPQAELPGDLGAVNVKQDHGESENHQEIGSGRDSPRERA